MDLRNSKANGGDLILTSGKGAAGGRDGSIIFKQGSQEVMRFSEDGKVFVRGEEVDDNSFVYDTFKLWLRSTQIIMHT